MSQVILHLGEDYIKEDLEYYFSGERDKNNQVRPNQNVYSMTPNSRHVDIDFSDGMVGNFFYPIMPQALDRIYIGISVSLFANYWGASFLLQLMKHVKPGGVIILPVYPEGQAAEKDYWSRSFLENIFLSRSRWSGTSNINAENDGVMTLRVGRKWPKPMPSSVEWFFQQRANMLLASLKQQTSATSISAELKAQFLPLCELAWREYQLSALLERIIIDFHAKDKPVTIQHIGQDYGLLVSDLILSPFIQMQGGDSWHIGEVNPAIKNSVAEYFEPHIESAHSTHYVSTDELALQPAAVMLLSHISADLTPEAYQSLIEKAWQTLEINGVLVIREQLDSTQQQALEDVLSRLGEIHYYSGIVASAIQAEVEISQYSLAVEQDLRQEKVNKDDLFRVIKKTA